MEKKRKKPVHCPYCGYILCVPMEEVLGWQLRIKCEKCKKVWVIKTMIDFSISEYKKTKTTK